MYYLYRTALHWYVEKPQRDHHKLLLTTVFKVGVALILMQEITLIILHYTLQLR